MEPELGFYATQSIALKLLLALALGGAIGLERQFRQHGSNLVTHALVALGAAAYSALPGALGLDAELRMGSQVITGIGFLGAGLIIKDGASIRGMSTAATLWSTGAVGVFTGYGFLLLATETTLFIVILNMALTRIVPLIDAGKHNKHDNERYYIVKLECASQEEANLRASLLQSLNTHNVSFRSIRSQPLEGRTGIQVETILICNGNKDLLVEELVGHLSLRPEVIASSWTRLDDDA